MGVDMGKVKQKADEEAQRALSRQAGGFKYWNPKPGKNRVRFMPPWTVQGPNANQFWREIYVHWGVGTDEDNAQSFACPVKTPHGPGGSCPVCHYVEQLRATKAPEDAELANQMRAKQRFYSNIVDLDDPTYSDKDVQEWKARQDDKTRECPFKEGDTKVQVFSYGPMIYKDLLDVFCDQGIDITDLNTGHDVVITREGSGRETKYRTRPDFNATVFAPRGRQISDVNVDLDRLMPFAPLEQMTAALTGTPTAPSSQQQVPAGKPAPGLPAANTGTQAQAQPRTQAAAPRTAAPNPAAAPQQQMAVSQQPVQQQKALPQAPPEDAPPCYKDLKTCNGQDAECVGGTKGDDIYDPCPFFGACNDAKVAASQPKTPSRRTAKKTPTVPDTSQSESVDDLEAQMRDSLQQ
jgi:hypothetical protein